MSEILQDLFELQQVLHSRHEKVFPLATQKSLSQMQTEQILLKKDLHALLQEYSSHEITDRKLLPLQKQLQAKKPTGPEAKEMQNWIHQALKQVEKSLELLNA